jgi:aspartyl-tRNA(Asn)/glutamyl-tRNA(Gln) amidotransferase subunit A
MKGIYGLVSRRGVFPLAYSDDHVRPLTSGARQRADARPYCGYDPVDPGSVDVAAGGYTADLGKSVKGITIGVIRHFYTRDMEGEAEIVASIEAALKVLTRSRLRRLGSMPRAIGRS